MTDDKTPSRAERVLWMLGPEFLLSLGIVVGALAIAVSLIEGPALDQFLYAIF